MNWFPHEETLFEGKGIYSDVKVVKNGTRYNLYTGQRFLQSSYDPNKLPQGTAFDWYLAVPWFSGNFKGYLDSLLILGLAAGSQVKLYNLAYDVSRIVGVEIDPLTVKLGKKYFDLNDTNLEIVVGDAVDYIQNTATTFELIILDAYKENKYDRVLGQKEILEKTIARLTKDGVMVINRVLGEVTNTDLENDLTELFKTVYALKVYNNVFYICTNSETAPKNAREVDIILKTATKENRMLSFLKSFKIANLRLIN